MERVYIKGIIVINYIFHPLTFLSNQIKEFSTLSFFYPSNQTHMRENKIFFILPLFHHFTNFSSSHFSIPPTKRTLNVHLTWICLVTKIIHAKHALCLAWIIFVNLFYYFAYFCYYLWAPLHFLVLFMGPTVLFQLIFNFIYNTFSKKFSILAK